MTRDLSKEKDTYIGANNHPAKGVQEAKKENQRVRKRQEGKD